MPDQDPDKIAQLFEAYVQKVAPKTVEVKVTRMHGGKPWMTEFDNPFVQAAGRAIEKGFGQEPVFTREGGSIPVVSTFQEMLGPAVGAVRRRSAGRERARAEREARPRQFPQRHHRVGLSLRRDWQGLIGDAPPVSASGVAALLAAAACARLRLIRRSGRRSRPTTDHRKLSELTSDRNGNGVIDTWTDMDGARPLRSRIDQNENGALDRWEYYDDQGTLAEGRLLAARQRRSLTRGRAGARTARSRASKSRRPATSRRSTAGKFYPGRCCARRAGPQRGREASTNGKPTDGALKTAEFDEDRDGTPRPPPDLQRRRRWS